MANQIDSERDSERESGNPDAGGADSGGVPAGPASTPIDHPYFLPVLLGAMALWFGYDGFIDPEMQKEYPLFNRVGFAVLLPATIWFGYKGWKEMQEIKAERDAAAAEPPSEA